MKGGFVSLEGEEAYIEWRDDKPFIEGYELENEKIALRLAGSYATGLGVLLVIVNALCHSEKEMFDELNRFNADMITNQNPGDIEPMWVKSALTLPYFAFSPDENLRRGATNGNLPPFTWKRLLRDQASYVVVASLINPASHNYIDSQLWRFLSNHQDQSVLSKVASLSSPAWVMETLASNEDYSVIFTLVDNPSLSNSALQIIAQHDDVVCRLALLERETLPREVIMILEKWAQDNPYVRTQLLKWCQGNREKSEQGFIDSVITLLGNPADVENEGLIEI